VRFTNATVRHRLNLAPDTPITLEHLVVDDMRSIYDTYVDTITDLTLRFIESFGADKVVDKLSIRNHVKFMFAVKYDGRHFDSKCIDTLCAKIRRAFIHLTRKTSLKKIESMEEYLLDMASEKLLAQLKMAKVDGKWVKIKK
jgi:hypothetical protein